MARQIRKPRYPGVTKGGFGNIALVLRAPVVPGETLQRLKLQFTLQSRPITTPLAGAWVDVAFYYVPCRLLDAAFVPGMISGSYTPPANMTGALASSFFAQSTQGVSALAVRAYDAVVNRYYRRPEIDGTWTTVMSGGLAPAPAADMTAEMFQFVTVNMADVAVPITDDATAEGSLSVDALWEAETKLRAARSRDNMSGTYSDYLAAFGVSRDDGEGFLMEPEFISGARKWVMPSKAVDQTDGDTVQTYFVTIDHQTSSRKYFSEHGILIGVAMIRPKWFIEGKLGMLDDCITNFWTDAAQVDSLIGDPTKEIGATQWVQSVATSLDLRNGLFRGEQEVGPGVNDYVASTAETFVARKNPASFAALRLADGLTIPSGGTVDLGAQWQADFVVSLKLATPLSRPQLY